MGVTLLKSLPCQNTVFPKAFDSINCLQTMDELDSVLTIEELSSVIYPLENHQELLTYYLI